MEYSKGGFSSYLTNEQKNRTNQYVIRKKASTTKHAHIVNNKTEQSTYKKEKNMNYSVSNILKMRSISKQFNNHNIEFQGGLKLKDSFLISTKHYRTSISPQKTNVIKNYQPAVLRSSMKASYNLTSLPTDTGTFLKLSGNHERSKNGSFFFKTGTKDNRDEKNTIVAANPNFIIKSGLKNGSFNFNSEIIQEDLDVNQNLRNNLQKDDFSTLAEKKLNSQNNLQTYVKKDQKILKNQKENILEKNLRSEGINIPCKNFLSIIASNLAKLDYQVAKSQDANIEEAKKQDKRLKYLKAIYKKLIKKFIGIENITLSVLVYSMVLIHRVQKIVINTHEFELGDFRFVYAGCLFLAIKIVVDVEKWFLEDFANVSGLKKELVQRMEFFVLEDVLKFRAGVSCDEYHKQYASMKTGMVKRALRKN